ncbi:MAG: hypothetical protein JMDDDDMK_00733 [Acidobacteria bacterium]|nr:hypothetical protein [Acidobacteriota bacterium]
MLAQNIIRSFQSRGFTIALAITGNDSLSVTPASDLTDEDRHLIKCYRTELLWRLRHPEGDPDPFVEGDCCPACDETLAVIEVEPHQRLETWERVKCPRGCGAWYRKLSVKSASARAMEARIR